MNITGIAISGKAGAGKDSLASNLSEILGMSGVWATRVGFADAVKDDVLRLHGLTKDMPGGRAKLIEYSNAERAIDPFVWIKRLESSLDSLSCYGFIPLVSDLRYWNELEWVRERGFITVRVDATMMDRGYQLYKRGEPMDLSESVHVSECELDEADFDFRFWNPHGDGSVALRHMAYEIARRFRGEEEEAAA